MRAETFHPATTEILSPLRQWTLHIFSFLLPLVNAVFLITGPHSWWAALLWTTPVWLLVLTDNMSPPDRRQPSPDAPAWPFDLQVYALIVLQLVDHVLLGVMASKIAVWPAPELGTAFANLVAVIVISGTTAGYTGIVLAHELIHRRNRLEHFLGRTLLALVIYEQFATEHVRGHHPRLGTAEDPATAQFGETFKDFIRRTIPAQFKSAWHLEKVRLAGKDEMSVFDGRWLQHRVLQGVVAEIGIVIAWLFVFGPVSLVFFVSQARGAVVLLEAVNYIEHWGIARIGRVVKPEDSWDTDNWFTLHTLVGLSRHADHHAQASRPYHQLRSFDESPKLPFGYYGTILMAMFRNERYRELVTAELRRCKLGPFRAAGSAAMTEPVPVLGPGTVPTAA